MSAIDNTEGTTVQTAVKPATFPEGTVPSASPILKIPIAQITQDNRLRIRPLNPTTVKRYAALLRKGVTPPTALMASIGNRLVMVDGHHWMEAAILIGRSAIDGLVIADRWSEAMTLAFSANTRCSRPLTVEEQKRGVRSIVHTMHWFELSDEDLAERLNGCLAPAIVALFRPHPRELSGSGPLLQQTTQPQNQATEPFVGGSKKRLSPSASNAPKAKTAAAARVAQETHWLRQHLGLQEKQGRENHGRKPPQDPQHSNDGQK